MHDPNCIFCKIVRKEIPKDITHEDEHTIAFLDINPKAPGHTLLITKEHYQWFLDLPEDINQKLFASAQKVGQKIKDDNHADYVRLGIIGTDIPHVHIHLIPQKLDGDKASI